MEYLGSKKRLLGEIENVIRPFNDDINVVCDLFAGTGAVSSFFKHNNDFQIVANDVQYYSFIQLFVTLNIEELPKFKYFNGLDNTLQYLNNIKPLKGFIFDNYSPDGDNEYSRMFFTSSNAMKIDGIRNEINNLFDEKKIDLNEKMLLIFLLINSIDRFSNTAVVYEAYLKEFKKESLKEFNIVDKSLPTFTKNKGKHLIFNNDALDIIKKLSGDLLYLDPPYNNRQYSRNYHMLETIAKYDNPEIKGKAGVRTDSFISGLSQKTRAKSEMKYILDNANFKFVLISYNNEGILSIDDFAEITKDKWILKVNEVEYSRFKSHSKNTKAKKVIEYLIWLEKKDER
jgi:adenine-specific DNA-methyltransferase